MDVKHTKNSTFTTFDKTCTITTRHQKPDRFRILNENISCLQIPRGAGLSYTPASFGKNILVREMTSFNRILEFNEEEKTVVVESGISLKKLLEWSFDHKLFLPVLPGHPDITIGGCIAANVHGKNPRKDGTFKEFVIEFELLNPKADTQKIERNTELFDATCGGLGLTGIIKNVKIQLQDLPSDKILMCSQKTNSLMESIEIIDKNEDADILYAWHNGSSFKNFGKGIVTIGKFSNKFHQKKLQIIKNTDIKKIKIPFSIWNKISSPLIFSIFQKMELHKNNTEKNIFEAFFPFTGIAQWLHVLYGKKGFREYQVLIPKNNIEKFTSEFSELVKQEKPNITLISIKAFRGNQKYLQFCGDGYSIVLECPNSNSVINFFQEMDKLIILHKGIPNIIKDSRLSKNIVNKCFNQYKEFNQILNKNDPDGIFKSQCSIQIGL